MLKSLKVLGLNGCRDVNVSFNEDLNILTGKNGVGKTTLLKLLWYMMSSNRELILSEIPFKYAQIVTDRYSFSIVNDESRAGSVSAAHFQYSDFEGITKEKKIVHERGMILSDEDREFIDELNRRADQCPEGTIFFPTFRRIEGGFSIDNRRLRRSTYGHVSRLSEAIEDYSRIMSSRNHQFIASISTADIEELLIRKYADISEKTNNLYLEFSRFIMMRLGQEVESSETGEVGALKFKDDIRNRLETLNKHRENLMRPFDTLADLIRKIFKDKGITISQNITLGQAKAAIRARILSAGEKQMFGFLSYNAFASNNVIFIDEPELSLHADWQRILFRMLLAQGSSNQFIITTHSPFIYSMYPEKELVIDNDRGEF